MGRFWGVPSPWSGWFWTSTALTLMDRKFSESVVWKEFKKKFRKTSKLSRNIFWASQDHLVASKMDFWKLTPFGGGKKKRSHIQLVQVTSQKFSAAFRSQATNSLKYNFLSNFWLLLRQMPWKVLRPLIKSPCVHVSDSKMRSKYRMSMSFVLLDSYESKQAF